MTKPAQDYPVEAIAFRASWLSPARKSDLPAPQEDNVSSEFLADLAERIAAACIGSEPQGPGRTVPLPHDANPLDAHCRDRPAPRAPGARALDIELFTADGHMRPLGKIEADVIRLAMSHYGGKVSEVARRLNIGRSTLYRKLDQHRIDYGPEAPR